MLKIDEHNPYKISGKALSKFSSLTCLLAIAAMSLWSTTVLATYPCAQGFTYVNGQCKYTNGVETQEDFTGLHGNHNRSYQVLHNVIQTNPHGGVWVYCKSVNSGNIPSSFQIKRYFNNNTCTDPDTQQSYSFDTANWYSIPPGQVDKGTYAASHDTAPPAELLSCLTKAVCLTNTSSTSSQIAVDVVWAYFYSTLILRDDQTGQILDEFDGYWWLDEAPAWDYANNKTMRVEYNFSPVPLLP